MFQQILLLSYQAVSGSINKAGGWWLVTTRETPWRLPMSGHTYIQPSGTQSQPRETLKIFLQFCLQIFSMQAKQCAYKLSQCIVCPPLHAWLSALPTDLLILICLLFSTNSVQILTALFYFLSKQHARACTVKSIIRKWCRWSVNSSSRTGWRVVVPNSQLVKAELKYL